MFKVVSIALLMLVTLVALMYSLKSQGGECQATVLRVYCAAGLQRPISEIARQYEAEHDVRIALHLAGSGVLESQLKVAGGDLYIPADESYVLKAKNEGLVSEIEPLVSLRAVMVVQKGNPKEITTLDDLKRVNVKLSMADATSAIGRYVQETLRQSGDWSSITNQIIVTKPTVNHVIEDVANSTVDATIAWDSVTATYDDVEFIRVPLFETKPRLASVGLVKKGNVEESRLFMYYLACNPSARNVFERLGYQSATRKGGVDE